MIHLQIEKWIIELTDKNESEVKESLRRFPLNSEAHILETGEVLQINDIFDYEQAI